VSTLKRGESHTNSKGWDIFAGVESTTPGNGSDKALVIASIETVNPAGTRAQRPDLAMGKRGQLSMGLHNN